MDARAFLDSHPTRSARYGSPNRYAVDRYGRAGREGLGEDRLDPVVLLLGEGAALGVDPVDDRGRLVGQGFRLLQEPGGQPPGARPK